MISLYRKLYNIHTDIKKGYTEYGIYFWIASLSTIIGAFVRLAGLAAFVFSLVFFFWMGKFHSHVEKEMAKE
ncbi:MAG: hypothetical protein QXV17_06775 [Candidatus Micrarchaeaceae archaeon]